jgi:NTP pyrophosphatase (non-canonical NTP hydrolase)
MKDFLKELRISNLIRQQEWDTDDSTHNPSYRGNELAGEVGEACNMLKKLHREEMGIAGSRVEVSELAEELADIIICVDLSASLYGIDLAKAVVHKFNKTSDKYGLNTKFNAIKFEED